ncbi:MAG: phosphoglycerate dehydrogenase [Gammaproteobacteria bacterium]|nr:phosphoglycerate dehydrogenase [Gammaproteobacteria bacterium]
MKNKTLIIDFDSTFIQTEALDELAVIALQDHPERDKIVDQIREITNAGMDGRISLSDSLARRLTLLQANKKHIDALITVLNNKISNSFRRNAQFLTQFSDDIYIVSSGFKEYIIPVVTQFEIKDTHVFANTFSFNAQGDITGLDNNNPLSQNQGKVKLVSSLNLAGDIWVIGDGITDYEIREANLAHVFFAFIENVRRPTVAAKADHILKNFDEFLYMNDFPRAISYPRNRIKILLLENIHPNGIKLLEDEGYNVETMKGSLSEEELISKIKDVSILGIRSKTTVSKKVLASAERLIAIGAFCIGTNQVDLSAATENGICVFNAPYSNTRSVVEMVIGEIIMLMRKVIPKNSDLHNGKWNKSADNCHEVRGKKLGIVGYGNIGSQLSVMAESLGMQVYYYDLIEKLQLGNAKKCNSLDELLKLSDIVSIHVDGRQQNENIIGQAQFQQMKDNVVFINLSRGHVVDVDALVEALKSGKILGAAIDVFQYEPVNNEEEFINPLRGYSNVILSPHIGGSTEEAQLNIGEFVARRIIAYVNAGDSTQSVNLPNIQLPELHKAHRLIHLHSNVPGILAQINQVLANHQVNLLGQYLKTNEKIGYVISDINTEYDKALHNELKKITHTIKSRVLY